MYRTEAGRYRKIYVRIWGDEKFRQLSPPQPNAQSLFIYLIVGPHAWPIPGLFQIGEAALAEHLGWPLKAFREAFREVFAKGMAKADWDAKVVYLPKAIHHNRPESPNVAKAWRRGFNDIPECDLKREAFQDFKDFLKDFPKAFAEAFAEDLPEPFAKTSGNHKPNPKPNTRTPLTPLLNDDEALPEFERFWQHYPHRVAKGAARKAWAAKKPEIAKVLVALDAAKMSYQWIHENGRYIPHPATWLNQERWLDDLASAPTNGHGDAPRVLKANGHPAEPNLLGYWFNHGCDRTQSRVCVKEEFWDLYAWEWGPDADRKFDQCDVHRRVAP